MLAVPALLEEETERISLITSATPCIKVFAKKLFVVAGTAATAVAAFCVARVCTVGKETTAVSVCVFQLKNSQLPTVIAVVVSHILMGAASHTA